MIFHDTARDASVTTIIAMMSHQVRLFFFSIGSLFSLSRVPTVLLSRPFRMPEALIPLSRAFLIPDALLLSRSFLSEGTVPLLSRSFLAEGTVLLLSRSFLAAGTVLLLSRSLRRLALLV